jgi:hypothetical protein
LRPAFVEAAQAIAGWRTGAMYVAERLIRLKEFQLAP